MGVQGKKRLAVAGADAVGTVDPVGDADYKRIEDVPLAKFDAALLCTPDEVKIGLLTYLLGNKKHALVEKPLLAASREELLALQKLAAANGVTCYTAYNHRFEPHFMRMKQVLDEGKIGRVYWARMFYGNGTARLVRESPWRDQRAGVLPDLGSHLLDTARFWFGDRETDFTVYSANRFENAAFDHISFGSEGSPLLEMEITLLNWRNDFYADVYGEGGSAHIRSLCKWGPATFTLRDRKLPSGRPDEQAVTLVEPDPTWALEYDHFKKLCAKGESNIGNDIWISDVLNGLTKAVMESQA